MFLFGETVARKSTEGRGEAPEGVMCIAGVWNVLPSRCQPGQSMYGITRFGKGKKGKKNLVPYHHPSPGLEMRYRRGHFYIGIYVPYGAVIAGDNWLPDSTALQAGLDLRGATA